MKTNSSKKARPKSVRGSMQFAGTEITLQSDPPDYDLMFQAEVEHKYSKFWENIPKHITGNQIEVENVLREIEERLHLLAVLKLYLNSPTKKQSTIQLKIIGDLAP